MSKITIYATKDTFVCSNPNSKSLNFGKQLNLIISPSNKALLYFDLSSIPANAIITSANLHLYLYRFQPLTPSSININQLKTDFYENIVTSDTTPDPFPQSDASTINIEPTSLNNYVTFNNLTNIISSWYDNSSTNHGFELSTSIDSTLSFFSREYTDVDLQPKLEIEYTINNDIPFIVTDVHSEILYQIDGFAETTISAISNTLFFNYFINNSIVNTLNNKRIEPDFAYVYLKTCNTKNGTYKNLGEKLTIDKYKTTSISVSPTNNYVKLFIEGTKDTCLNVSSIYKTFNTVIPSSVKLGEIVGDKIILTMTKPLIGATTANNADFIINLPGNKDEFGKVTVIDSWISGTTVTLVCSENAPFINEIFPDVALSYFPSGINDLTGVAGDVFSFTNRSLQYLTPTVFLDQQEFSLVSTSIQTTPWDISYYKSRVQTFKYVIAIDSTTWNFSAAIEGSNFIDQGFTTIGSVVTINNSVSSQAIYTIAAPLKTNYKYMRLSIFPNTPSSMKLHTLYTAYPDFIPSKIPNEENNVAVISNTGAEIILRFTKTLNDIVDEVGAEAFTINYRSEQPSEPSKLTTLTVSNTTVTINVNPPIKSSDAINLTYKKTGINNLTGENGDVDNFFDISLDNTTS